MDDSPGEEHDRFQHEENDPFEEAQGHRPKKVGVHGADEHAGYGRARNYDDPPGVRPCAAHRQHHGPGPPEPPGATSGEGPHEVESPQADAEQRKGKHRHEWSARSGDPAGSGTLFRREARALIHSASLDCVMTEDGPNHPSQTATTVDASIR